MFLVHGTRTYTKICCSLLLLLFVVVVVVVVVVVLLSLSLFVPACVAVRVVLDHVKRHGALSRVRDAAHRRQHCCY